MLPSDPIILMSFLNTKLRDEYDSLSSLCEDLELAEDVLSEKLRAAGFEYDPIRNQFR